LAVSVTALLADWIDRIDRSDLEIALDGPGNLFGG
jgi:hypothetical protein